MRLLFMLLMFTSLLLSNKAVVKSNNNITKVKKVLTDKESLLILAKEWRAFTYEERASILKSYADGTEDNLSLTLASINWQESFGGRWLISTDHNDIGVYHVNIYWYLKAIGVKDTIWNRSKYASILLTNPDIELRYVKNKLKNNLLVSKGSYYKTWWRYNGSESYAKKIRLKVIFLRRLLRAN